MIPDLHAEWGKLCSLRSPWACLLAAVLLVPGTAYTLANNVTYDIDQGRAPAGLSTPPLEILGSSLQFGLAMFIAFAMLAITSEYVTGSVRSTLLAQPRRWRVLLAKTAVVTVAAAAVGAAVAAGTYELVELSSGTMRGRVPRRRWSPRAAGCWWVWPRSWCPGSRRSCAAPSGRSCCPSACWWGRSRSPSRSVRRCPPGRASTG